MNIDSKYIWYTILKDGYYGVRPSYYGGYEFDNISDADERYPHLVKDGRFYSSEALPKIKELALNDIEKIGIEWGKTKDPEEDFYSCFEGTFSPSSKKKGYYGTLILKDGSELGWFMKAEKLSSKPSSIIKFMQDKDSQIARILGLDTQED